jgi:hypothetical protein
MAKSHLLVIAIPGIGARNVRKYHAGIGAWPQPRALEARGTMIDAGVSSLTSFFPSLPWRLTLSKPAK